MINDTNAALRKADLISGEHQVHVMGTAGAVVISAIEGSWGLDLFAAAGEYQKAPTTPDASVGNVFLTRATPSLERLKNIRESSNERVLIFVESPHLGLALALDTSDELDVADWLAQWRRSATEILYGVQHEPKKYILIDYDEALEYPAAWNDLASALSGAIARPLPDLPSISVVATLFARLLVSSHDSKCGELLGELRAYCVPLGPSVSEIRVESRCESSDLLSAAQAWQQLRNSDTSKSLGIAKLAVEVEAIKSRVDEGVEYVEMLNERAHALVRAKEAELDFALATLARQEEAHNRLQEDLDRALQRIELQSDEIKSLLASRSAAHVEVQVAKGQLEEVLNERAALKAQTERQASELELGRLLVEKLEAIVERQQSENESICSELRSTSSTLACERDRLNEARTEAEQAKQSILDLREEVERLEQLRDQELAHLRASHEREGKMRAELDVHRHELDEYKALYSAALEHSKQEHFDLTAAKNAGDWQTTAEENEVLSLQLQRAISELEELSIERHRFHQEMRRLRDEVTRLREENDRRERSLVIAEDRLSDSRATLRHLERRIEIESAVANKRLDAVMRLREYRQAQESATRRLNNAKIRLGRVVYGAIELSEERNDPPHRHVELSLLNLRAGSAHVTQSTIRLVDHRGIPGLLLFGRGSGHWLVNWRQTGEESGSPFMLLIPADESCRVFLEHLPTSDWLTVTSLVSDLVTWFAQTPGDVSNRWVGVASTLHAQLQEMPRRLRYDAIRFGKTADDTCLSFVLDRVLFGSRYFEALEIEFRQASPLGDIRIMANSEGWSVCSHMAHDDSSGDSASVQIPIGQAIDRGASRRWWSHLAQADRDFLVGMMDGLIGLMQADECRLDISSDARQAVIRAASDLRRLAGGFSTPVSGVRRMVLRLSKRSGKISL